MPRTKREKPLYQRGQFRLHRRKDRVQLEILWYDETAKRERRISARTADVREGIAALDRHYLTTEGQQFCPTCLRPFDGTLSGYVVTAIADYLILGAGKAGEESAKRRLGHVTRYINANNLAEIRCSQIDEKWIAEFRQWRLAETPKPSRSYIEGSVMQLAAAINATQPHSAMFKAQSMTEVSNTPTYRADIPKIAEMFRYAMAIPDRENLLRYLRAAVATWARPDALFDIHSDQWVSNIRVLALNPSDRLQTKKYRPTIPVAHQFAKQLDALDGVYLPITTVYSTWAKMGREIGLPDGRQAGPKVIRRSMATIAKKRMGLDNWQQGEVMLGHRKASTSDIYALPDPMHLGLALQTTETIIDEIESLAPGAFYTQITPNLISIEGGKS